VSRKKYRIFKRNPAEPSTMGGVKTSAYYLRLVTGARNGLLCQTRNGADGREPSGYRPGL
jgi:hypothetical protein